MPYAEIQVGQSVHGATPPPPGTVLPTVEAMRPSGVVAPNFKMAWTDYRHPEYVARFPQWVFCRDHYTGQILLPTKLPLYLYQRARGEPREAWAERLLIADYTPHFSAVVDSLAGMLFGSEADATRKWGEKEGEGLGSQDDPQTPAGRLWRDADGMGADWTTIWKLLASDLISIHDCWVVVDSLDGEPVVRLFPAESVVNWRMGEYGIEEALVCETADMRTSIREEPRSQYRYVHYRLDGWSRHYKDEKTQEVVNLTGPGDTGTYQFRDHRGYPQLPIFRVSLPLRRMVGYIVARKANAIFNLESARDFLLRVANFPKLNLIAKDTLFKKLVKGLADGDNILQNDPTEGIGHNYIAPLATSAQVAGEALVTKVENFYVTAFREYGDMAREKTATEVRQDVASGVGAFLTLLKAGVDNAENAALWRIEQTLWPENPERWFKASVERSDDFLPPDINAVIERLQLRYYGPDRRVPLGRSAQIHVAKQIADWDGLEVNEDEIAAAVDAENILRLTDALVGFELPPVAKSRLGVRLLEVTGLIHPAEEVDGVDGKKVKLREQLMKQMEDMEEGKRADAQNQREFQQGLRQRQLQEPLRPPPGARAE